MKIRLAKLDCQYNCAITYFQDYWTIRLMGIIWSKLMTTLLKWLENCYFKLLPMKTWTMSWVQFWYIHETLQWHLLANLILFKQLCYSHCSEFFERVNSIFNSWQAITFNWIFLSVKCKTISSICNQTRFKNGAVSTHLNY